MTMKRIITLTGLKQSGKVKLAETWDRNENVSYIRPVKNPKTTEEYLASAVVNGNTYVYYESQLVNDFNVLIYIEVMFKTLQF